uniref:Alcohol dehydrogenase n=1 Tax=Glossina brevipalpis TaxID=37001 RepID=A0A1A9WPS6_9MUSC
MDVTEKKSIEDAIRIVIDTVKYIDVLVNGAGILSDRNIEATINVNLIGLINTTMIALPYMDKSQYGRGGLILNIASALGLEPCPPLAIYSSSKFGVIGFTRSLSDPFYFKRTGVAITAICPGMTSTPMVLEKRICDTFDYSKPLTDEFFNKGVRQSASICGEHLVEIIEKSENGTLWISDRSELRLVEPKVFWEL